MYAKSSNLELILKTVVIVIILVLILILVSRFSEKSEAQTTTTKAPVLDPLITKYCEILTKKKNEKVQYINRLKKLIKKNEELQSITPTLKKTIKLKLEKNHKIAERNLFRAKKKFKAMEIDFIRKGCPKKI